MTRKARTPNFNHLAGVYVWLERFTFGTALERCRRAWLNEAATARSALVLGDGDGRFTARLLAQNATIGVDAVDASRAMLRTLVRRAGIHAARVRVHLADARAWSPRPANYDLVATHFFLDCLTTEEVTALAKRVRPALAPDARWLVSEFAIPPGWLGWVVARPVVTGLYLAFDLLTGLRLARLPDYHRALREAGFALEAQKPIVGGLLTAEIWRPLPVPKPAQTASFS